MYVGFPGAEIRKLGIHHAFAGHAYQTTRHVRVIKNGQNISYPVTVV
ncbi:hypothetical protein [Bacillus toyonensis]|nr:hypothetical protein [Bacillus toyonensis]